MEYEITQVQKGVFIVASPKGQVIPKASPSSVSGIARQIQQEFAVNASGIRFFWPDGDDAEMMIAMLPDWKPAP